MGGAHIDCLADMRTSVADPVASCWGAKSKSRSVSRAKGESGARNQVQWRGS